MGDSRKEVARATVTLQSLPFFKTKEEKSLPLTIFGIDHLARR